jgi:hypothetical protein
MHMKNLVKNVIAVVLLVVSGAGVSATELPVKVKVAGDKSIELSLEEISGKVWITFKDMNGYVFYTKKIKDLTSYTVKYDLAAFPDGEYQLELDASSQTLNVPVTIMGGTVMLKEELADAPAISTRGNVVAVELKGKTNMTWNVLITNLQGELIFNETVENEERAKRKYDLSNLNNGAYTLQFKSAGNSFSHQVIVKN